MSYFMLIIGLFLIPFSLLRAESLKKFETDYCTGYREGTLEHPKRWQHCCVEHDLYFWAGGSKKDRIESDRRLKSCVIATGHKLHAHMIFLGVSLGGISPFKIKDKQWGNGWIEREDYAKLSEIETFEIIHFLEISQPELAEELKKSFIEQLKSRLE